MGKTKDLLKKITYQGNFHARMGLIKDRNDQDLTEAEKINKRWQEYTKELYKNSLLTGIIMMMWSLTQSQTSWSVRSTGPYKYYSNKASGGDGIPGELFTNLKEVAVKVLDPICQQIWKIQH